MKGFRMLAAALPLAALLGGCGGDAAKGAAAKDSAAAARASAPKPAATCGLLSLQEVEKITGMTLVPGPVNPDLQGYSRCEWSVTPGKSDGIILVVNREGRLRDYATAPGAAPLAGFADSASWSPRLHQMAVKRDTGTIAVSMVPDSSKKAWGERILHTALERLKEPNAKR